MEIEKLMQGALQKLESVKSVNLTALQKPSSCSKCKTQLPNHPDRNILCEKDSYDFFVSEKERMRKNIPYEMERVGFPKKFCIGDFKAPAWIEKYPSERGLFLTGDVGVGKTVSMALIVRNHLEAMCTPDFPHLLFPGKEEGGTWEIPGHRQSIWRFINFPSFIMEIQDAYKKEGESALDILKRSAEVPFLIIDDLGAEKMTDYVRQATYYIINEREMNERPTFITSNFSLDELNNHIDARVASRIAGMCDIKKMKNNDQRVRKS